MSITYLDLQAALSARWLDWPMAALSTGCEGWALALPDPREDQDLEQVMFPMPAAAA